LKKRLPVVLGIRGRILPIVLCAAAVLLLGASYPGLGRLVYDNDSLYHRIFVYRSGAVVTLQFGRRDPMLVQSQVDLRNLRRHMVEYTTLAFCGLLYNQEPSKVLILGLGGGVIPREMRHYFPEMEIDVAEIDPAILPVAERFFSFRTDDKLQVHITDGRMFVRSLLRKDPVPRYDMVILDAFTSDYIPFHLMTREFIEEVKGVLADGGVVVANVFSSNKLFDAEFRTFDEVFGRCDAFVGASSGNAMLVSPGPGVPAFKAQELSERAAALQTKHLFAFDLRQVAARFRPGLQPDPRAKVLTDDRAPVNWLRTQPTEMLQGELVHPAQH
jgi:spermidine synthase